MSLGYNSVWEIKEAIKCEKLKLENTLKSSKQWNIILNDVTTDVTNVTTTGHEWQIRYDCQHLYNRMLQKQLQSMRTELRMMRYGIELPGRNQVDYETVGEWRNHLKHLHIEKWSLKSLERMSERQIDSESMEYFRSRDLLTQMTNDMKNCRQSWISAQEKVDEETLVITELRDKKKNLRPVAKIVPFTPVQPRRKSSGYSERFQGHANSRQ